MQRKIHKSGKIINKKINAHEQKPVKKNKAKLNSSDVETLLYTAENVSPDVMQFLTNLSEKKYNNPANKVGKNIIGKVKHFLKSTKSKLIVKSKKIAGHPRFELYRK